MKKIMFALVFLFSFPCFAVQRYAVEREDGGVSIVNYYGGEPLESVLTDLGFWGRPIYRIKDGDLPEGRVDRNYWKINDLPFGSQVVIDSNKKNAEKEEKNKEKQDRKAVLDKLKISEKELEMLEKK